MEAGEGFETIEGTRLFEGFRVELDRRVRGIDAGAAAVGLLRVTRMRRAVGAEEEFRAAAGGSRHQRSAVLLALEDRQAVMVRPDPAHEQRIAVQQQVMRSDGRGDVGGRGADELRRRGGGDVLEYQPQVRKLAHQGLQMTLDEHRFAIEDVDIRAGHLAVQQQGHAVQRHRREHRIAVRDVRDSVFGIGGCVRGVVFHRLHDSAGLGASDLLRGRVGCEIERHQRLERLAGRNRRQDALAIGDGLLDRRHLRLEVGHHDRPPETPHGVRQHRSQGRAIAQMEMPVIGASQRQAGRGHVRGVCAIMKEGKTDTRMHPASRA